MAHWRRPGFNCIGQRPAPVMDGMTALVVGGPPGPVSGDQISEENKQSLEKIQSRRDWARRMGYTKAADVLDRYLSATGEFQEIPAEKVQLARDAIEDSHKQKFLTHVKEEKGARTMIAFLGLIKPDRKARPDDEWPAKLKFKMSLLSGKEMAGVNEDNLMYSGSQLKSEMIIECNRGNVPRTYICKITKWRGWVVDNFDWEFDKQFGADIAFFKWLLPSQAAMNRLLHDGLGRPYQRSSRSFDLPFSVADWQELFKTDEEVEQAAEARRMKIQWTKDEDERNPRAGSQPIPGPAEEILSSMRM
jgi:hypothetical protein